MLGYAPENRRFPRISAGDEVSVTGPNLPLLRLGAGEGDTKALSEPWVGVLVLRPTPVPENLLLTTGP